MSPLRSTFEIAERHGIWRVTLDGVFFGDYRSQANALDGLGDAQRALTSAGRVVSVVAPQSEG
jgi:hypothetical protein